MRIDRFLVKIVFSISVLCLLSQLTYGQRSIVLRNYPDLDMKTFNFNGAEVYVQIEDSNYYVPKVAPFEFKTTKLIDNLIEQHGKKDVSFLIRNARYDFIITMRTAMYLEYHSFGMYIYVQNKKPGYTIIFLETHSLGTASQILEIRPNKLWKRKYYKSDGK